MEDLTEYEKTLLSLWTTDGRKGLFQYLVRDGMNPDSVNDFIDTLSFISSDNEGIVPKPIDPEAGLEVTSNPILEQSVDPELEPYKEQPLADTPVTQGETVTVTFPDGSTKEVDVGAEGQVLAPVFQDTPEDKSLFQKLTDVFTGND